MLTALRTYWTSLVSHFRTYKTKRQSPFDPQFAQDVAHQILKNSRDVVWISSVRDYKLLYISPGFERIWGRSPDFMYKDLSACMDAVHPDDRQMFLDATRHSATREWQCEYRVVRPDGTIRWVQVRGVPIFDARGEPYRMVGLSEDITERKQIDAELRESESRYRILSERVIHAQEEERRRIARELHDSLGQSLTSLLIGLRGIEQFTTDKAIAPCIAHLRETATNTIDDVQRLARGLRPVVLDDIGFTPAIQRYVSDCARTYQLEIDLHTNDLESPHRLASEHATALYRIVQEALTNVVRHAEAKHVSVVIERHPKGLRAIIEDDGKGFCTEKQFPTTSHGLGLIGIRERASMLGGKTTIESGPNQGTALFVDLPLN